MCWACHPGTTEQPTCCIRCSPIKWGKLRRFKKAAMLEGKSFDFYTRSAILLITSCFFLLVLLWKEFNSHNFIVTFHLSFTGSPLVLFLSSRVWLLNLRKRQHSTPLVVSLNDESQLARQSQQSVGSAFQFHYIQGHLKVSCYVSFSSLLHPGQSGARPSWSNVLSQAFSVSFKVSYYFRLFFTFTSLVQNHLTSQSQVSYHLRLSFSLSKCHIILGFLSLFTLYSLAQGQSAKGHEV